MLGDGTCDSNCFNIDCSYDLADCCECTDEELGQCDYKCLNANCAYDEGCADDFLKDSAKYNQLLKKDFHATLDFEECYEADSSCTRDDLEAFYAGQGTDLTKCKSVNCFSQYGQTECCPASMHCKKCIDGQCLECEEGYVHYYTQCIQTCPPGFVLQDKIPNICYRNLYSAYTDVSSEDYYSDIIVGTGDIFPNYKKYSLVDGLANVWNAYTAVIVVDPVVDFGPMSEKNRGETWSKSIYSPFEKSTTMNIKRVLIESNVCSKYPFSPCLEERTELRVTHVKMTLVVSGFQLILSNFKISGYYAFKSSCDEATCSYCPYLRNYQDNYFDDRHNKYTSKPDWPECSPADTSFIETDCNGGLTLDGIDVNDFRMNHLAFINARGSVSITKTNFSNVSSSGEKAFIYQDCSKCESCNFSFSKSSCTHFNNGYEIRDDSSMPGFINTLKSEKATVSSSKFLSSITKSTQANSFISFQDIKSKATVKECIFTDIGVNYSLIYFYFSYESNDNRPTINSDNYSATSLDFQVSLESVYVERVTASSILFVYMQIILVNVKISYFDIYNSAVLNSVIAVEFYSSPTELNKYGGIDVTTVNGKKLSYRVDPSKFSYKNIKFEKVYWGVSAFTTLQCTNEVINGLSIVNSGQYIGDVNTFTYAGLVNDDSMYISILPDLATSLNCDSTVLISSPFNIEIIGAHFDRVVCSGNTGVVIYTLGNVSLT